MAEENETAFFDLKRDMQIVAKHATTETQVKVVGGWLVITGLNIRSTADRLKLEGSGWRKRPLKDGEWFHGLTRDQQPDTDNKKDARAVFEGYKDKFDGFVNQAKAVKAAQKIPVKDAQQEVEQPRKAEPQAPAKVVEAEQLEVDKEEIEMDNKRTLEIPVGGLMKAFVGLSLIAALAFGGYGLVTGKLSSEKQVVDVVNHDSMSIMSVQENSGEWLVEVGLKDKENTLQFIRKPGEYNSSTWFDGQGRRLNGGDAEELEKLFQADKVRKQADEILHEGSNEVSTD